MKEKNGLHGFFSLSFNSLNLKIVLFTAFQVTTAALVPAQKKSLFGSELPFRVTLNCSKRLLRDEKK